MPTVVVSNVRKQFGDVVAVEDVSFEVSAGEVFGLLGPNGAGKTTAIRVMLGIFAADAGHVDILGVPWTRPRRTASGTCPRSGVSTWTRGSSRRWSTWPPSRV